MPAQPLLVACAGGDQILAMIDLALAPSEICPPESVSSTQFGTDTHKRTHAEVCAGEGLDPFLERGARVGAALDIRLLVGPPA
jgi:hypothetical protein